MVVWQRGPGGGVEAEVPVVFVLEVPVVFVLEVPFVFTEMSEMSDFAISDISLYTYSELRHFCRL